MDAERKKNVLASGRFAKAVWKLWDYWKGLWLAYRRPLRKSHRQGHLAYTTALFVNRLRPSTNCLFVNRVCVCVFVCECVCVCVCVCVRVCA